MSGLSRFSVTNSMISQFSNVPLFISLSTDLFKPTDGYICLGRYFTGQSQNSLSVETTLGVTLNTFNILVITLSHKIS